jgi:vancomycin permeability regulator SanA
VRFCIVPYSSDAIIDDIASVGIRGAFILGTFSAIDCLHSAISASRFFDARRFLVVNGIKHNPNAWWTTEKMTLNQLF